MLHQWVWCQTLPARTQAFFSAKFQFLVIEVTKCSRKIDFKLILCLGVCTVNVLIPKETPWKLVSHIDDALKSNIGNLQKRNPQTSHDQNLDDTKNLKFRKKSGSIWQCVKTLYPW